MSLRVLLSESEPGAGAYFIFTMQLAPGKILAHPEAVAVKAGLPTTRLLITRSAVPQFVIERDSVGDGFPATERRKIAPVDRHTAAFGVLRRNLVTNACCGLLVEGGGLV
jgi:hypothetical protein